MFPFPRIVFFGTPEFAVESLKQLVAGGYAVVAVVTAPDKPSGRGLKVKVSPVKEFALLHGIPVLQPMNLKDLQFHQELTSFHPDLQIVIAFRMMPRIVWELPSLGTFNLHASLLPQYRGAAPINRAIMNGETETGVTTFFINDEIDKGKVLLSEKVMVGPDETAGELHDRLMINGAKLVLTTVNGIVSGTIHELNQDTLVAGAVSLKQAPKIFREDCRINWNQGVKTIHDFIRGLSPDPGAFMEVKMKDGGTHLLKIFRAVPEEADHHAHPGEIFTDGKSVIKIASKNGFIHLGELQLSGRKPMNSGEFLRGFGRNISETHGI